MLLGCSLSLGFSLCLFLSIQNIYLALVFIPSSVFLHMTTECCFRVLLFIGFMRPIVNS